MPTNEEASVMGRGQVEMVPERGLPFSVSPAAFPRPGATPAAADSAFPAAGVTAFPDDADLSAPRDLDPHDLPGLFVDKVAPFPADLPGPAPAAEAAFPAPEPAAPAGAAAPIPEPAPPAGVAAPIPEPAPPAGVAAPIPEPAAPAGAAAPIPEPAVPVAAPASPPAAGIYARPGPGMTLAPVRVDDLVADDRLLDFLVPDSRLEKLWLRTDAAQREIAEKIDNLTLAQDLLDRLQQVRGLVLEKRGNYEEAERQLAYVEYRLQFSDRVEAWSRRYGIPLLLYEVAWALGLGAVMFFLVPNLAGVARAAGVVLGDARLADMTIAATTMAWGGLGGVVGALLTLWTHIAREQDFDRQYNMWYITNPIMGVVLGSFIFLVVRSGLLSLTSSSSGIESPWLVYTLAWLTGFQQNVALELVRRMIKILVGDQGSGGGKAAAGASGESGK